MTSTSDLGVLAQLAYQAGITPLDFAEEQVTLQVGVYMALLAAGDDFGIHLDPSRMTAGAVACRILGGLLDAGWQPPVWPIPEPGVPDVQA